MVTRYVFAEGHEDSVGNMEEHPHGEYILYNEYSNLLERCLRAERELWELEVEWRTFAQRGTYEEGFKDGVEDGWNRAEHAWR